jgi:hypothetical protein
MASRGSLVMFMKSFAVFLISLFIFTSCQVVSSQTANINDKKPVIETDASQFYEMKMLKSDYKQVAVVAYVDIKERVLVDSIGSGDCESDKGAGYCLYRLKVEVKEIYKGKIMGKTLEFYTSPDADYPKKYLMGEKVVFLEWSEENANKERRLGTMENSTRSIEYDILKKMRKIAGKKIKPERLV